MNNIGFRPFLVILVLAAFMLSVSAKPNSWERTKEKIEVEELLEKHLQSIGTVEVRNSIKSIMAVGRSKAVFSGRGAGVTEGIVVVASQGDRNLIGMKFNNPDYMYEKMAYDGEKFSVGFAKAGVRSVLGGFLRVNQKTFKKGIMGSVLSTSWELLNYDEKEGKLKSKGTAKDKDGKKLYKFEYNIRKGSDLDVMMFFDAETFRHVKTEYKRIKTSGLGRSTGNSRGVAVSRVDNSAQQSEARYKMVEEFSDFRDEGGLTIPHTYDLYLEIQTGNGNTKDRWEMKLESFIYNQNYEIGQFQM
jgi:hypothetical protein